MKYHVMLTARKLLSRCEAHLSATYPDGGWEAFPYYRMELGAMLGILRAIGYERHEFGRYLIRNGAAGRKLENVGTDLTHTFVLFLTSGCAMGKLDGSRARVTEYLERENDIEHLVIHEMIGTFIRKARPGIERYYHQLE